MPRNSGGQLGPSLGTAMGTKASQSATDLLKKALQSFDPSKYIADPGNTKKKGVFRDPSLAASAGTQTQKITITADNSQAIKAVDVIAKRIQSLSSIQAIDRPYQINRRLKSPMLSPKGLTA